MKNQNGIILWVLGGTGVLFLYAAYKNKNPQAILLDHLRGTNTTAPIADIPQTGVTGSSGAVAVNTTAPDNPIPAVYMENPALYIATGAISV